MWICKSIYKCINQIPEIWAYHMQTPNRSRQKCLWHWWPAAWHSALIRQPDKKKNKQKKTCKMWLKWDGRRENPPPLLMLLRLAQSSPGGRRKPCWRSRSRRSSTGRCTGSRHKNAMLSSRHKETQLKYWPNVSDSHCVSQEFFFYVKIRETCHVLATYHKLLLETFLYTKPGGEKVNNVPPIDVRLWQPWCYAINPYKSIAKSLNLTWCFKKKVVKAGMWSFLCHLQLNHVSAFCLKWSLKYSCGKIESPVFKSQGGALINFYFYFFEIRSRLWLLKLKHSYCTSSIDFT